MLGGVGHTEVGSEHELGSVQVSTLTLTLNRTRILTLKRTQ